MKQLYMWYCAAAYSSFLLVVVGMVSCSWADKHTVTDSAQWGLWAYCLHNHTDTLSRHECAAYAFGHVAVWFDVSRVFASVSLVLQFALTPVSCYLHHQDDKQEDVFLLTAMAVVSAIMGLLGAILYDAVREAGEGTLSWGFAVYISGHVMSVAMFVILCTLHCCQPKRKPVRPYFM